jgi:hypothetical protein
MTTRETHLGGVSSKLASNVQSNPIMNSLNHQIDLEN